MPFSERSGYKPIRSALQRESVDERLRIKLWNAFFRYFIWRSDETTRRASFIIYWCEYFNNPINAFPYDYVYKLREHIINNEYPSFIKYVQKYFNECKWYELYDIIEFTFSKPTPLLEENDLNSFKDELNYIMQQEMAAYRIVGNQVVEISDDAEIKPIEECLKVTRELKGPFIHLNTALKYLSNLEDPDFRNSIKESISAVESIANMLTGTKSNTLDSALKMLEKRKLFHPALIQGFSKIYGYTCDAEGIRHSLHDEPNLTLADAKFMLVACSAFINYLISKAADKGISLG